MRKILCVLLSVLLVCSFTLSVSATTSVELAVPQIQQVSGSNWCWAACGASAVNFVKSSGITQQDFYSSTTNLLIYDYTRGATCTEVLGGLSRYNMSGTVRSWTTVGNSQILSMEQIYAQLCENKPIFAHMAYYVSSIGHCYLIRGCIDGNTVLSDYVSLMDPDTGSYVLMNYTSLCDTTNTSYWMEALYNVS